MFNVCPECEHVAPGHRPGGSVECPACHQVVVMDWVEPPSRVTHWASSVSIIFSMVLLFTGIASVSSREFYLNTEPLDVLGWIGLWLVPANVLSWIGLSKARDPGAWFAVGFAVFLDWLIVMLYVRGPT